jgi:glycosyltransferase involved in cell wall biosynthesis
MKLAFIIRLYLPQRLGGMEVATDAITRRLAERGHEVHVITSRYKGSSQSGKRGGVFVHRVFPANLRFAWYILFPIKALFAVKRIDPEFVQSQSLFAGIAGLLSKKLLKKPYAVWGRGSDVYLSSPFARPIYARVMANADIVMALTNDMKTNMQKNYSRVINVIPNGVDLDPFNNINRDEARTRLNLPKDERIIIFVGSLTLKRGVKKGVNYLIEAMKLIHERATSTKLLIAGDGPAKKQLESLAGHLGINEFVQFLGRVERENVPLYLVASDVFVLPSLSGEGFPNVVLEAMAAGLPLVTTDIEQLAEIVKQDVNGFLVEPKNPAQIAEKVLLLLNDAQLRARMSKTNEETAHTYSWNPVVDRLEDLYLNFRERQPKRRTFLRPEQ